MPIKAVLFDMFDTLMLIEKPHQFYSPALMRAHNYLNRHGIDVPFEKFNEAYIEARDSLYVKADANFEEPHFNLRISEALKLLGYNYSQLSPLVVAATNEFCYEFMKHVRIDENTKPLLKSLHRKYKIGIISNFAIPECVHELLSAEEVEGFFDLVVVSAAVNKRKPHPEIFQNTLKTLGLLASETVFIGDTADADVEGAKAAGLKAVYIERRSQRFDKISPDYTIKNLNELPSTLELFG